jgi:hydrogenase maturation protein HypF
VLSEHLGELANPAAYRNFVAAVDRLKTILNVDPEAVVCDLHPMYRSTRFARTLGLPMIEVQHHHAHIESCKAENGITEPVLGLAVDGTGYGPDGAIWGCELMLCNGHAFERLAHLRYFPLVGGDLAAKETWRPAAGLLFDAFGQDWRDVMDFGDIPSQTLQLVDNRLSADRGGVLTSSLGRLFDAVAFITGIADCNEFEASAPMALESAAESVGDEVAPLEFGLVSTDDGLELDARPVIRDLVVRRNAGESGASMASAFHNALARIIGEATGQLAQEKGIGSVALSGGCLLNRILLRKLTENLAYQGLAPYIHRVTPPGDGGLALGQAAVGVQQLLQKR